MKFYKFALWKAFFDKGYSLLSYPKYILILMGVGDVIASGGKSTNVIIVGIAFGIFCFLLGWFWYHNKIVNAEIEVSNQYNPFVHEMRKVYKPRRL